MSDYVRQNDFSIKDALPSGSAQKIIKGTDVDAEFDVIVTAIASKLDNISAPTTGHVPLIGSSGTTLTDSGYALTAVESPYYNVKAYQIKEYTQDPRIMTELVDHLPASATVPTPLKFFGRIIGTPGELNYYKDMVRYAEALDKASDRALMWKIGQSEEGRDMIVLAVADEATIKQLDKYKGLLASLSDPRKTTDAQAQQILRTAKPIYWLTAGMHSGETGGPEMLQELAYRLIVEETPFI